MAKHRLRRNRLPAPPVLLALLYLGLILTGSALLSLPFASTDGLTLADAFFTATSAVTVTGLSVIDVGRDLTVFGQTVLLVLVQIGGVGLMTFAVLLLSSLGLKINAHSRHVLREDLNQSTTHQLMKLAGSVVRISLAVEAAGVAVLCLVFVPDLGIRQGLWYAIFHSVSAFNNAGFGLRSDSLSFWVSDPIINIAVPALFITGGLGFVVIGDIMEKRGWRLLSLHTKLMIVGSVGLTIYGTVGFAALEWTNPGTLGGLGTVGEKLAASWFQSVTTRTAGFNTVDLSHIHDSTSLMMIALMLVGGGSASTAGGIKVTTLMVALMATVAFFKQRSPRAFGRRIGPEQVLKVMALTTIAMLTMLTGLFLVSISHDGDFLDLAFEVASAFGTTGLSRGATGELDALGRTIMIFLMFLGRVGPLTLGYFLATKRASRVKFPEGRVYLG
ncbi:TrkH family potassium uptake protein [Tropicimonas sediminicola]|uniref:Trk system potassium uptake protein TrkH n=1 Tax=Tropicimonas sediminicola TaxID=1031541 RepID=A0A239L0T3_9RHOB|nr:TrkH family potassium uptake protein [Tropicimonas sediminicola]SNT23463.1 trk system potassium uptake protein TrkH [Tropicimonas sediminicola]